MRGKSWNKYRISIMGTWREERRGMWEDKRGGKEIQGKSLSSPLLSPPPAFVSCSSFSSHFFLYLFSIWPFLALLFSSSGERKKCVCFPFFPHSLPSHLHRIESGREKERQSRIENERKYEREEETEWGKAGAQNLPLWLVSV